MVFCNKYKTNCFCICRSGHNPYFNRWFSAIKEMKEAYEILKACHNPYFNRWFSAIYNQNR